MYKLIILLIVSSLLNFSNSLQAQSKAGDSPYLDELSTEEKTMMIKELNSFCKCSDKMDLDLAKLNKTVKSVNSNISKFEKAIKTGKYKKSKVALEKLKEVEAQLYDEDNNFVRAQENHQDCMHEIKANYTEEESKLSREVEHKMQVIMLKEIGGNNLEGETDFDKMKEVSQSIFGFCPTLSNHLEFIFNTREMTQRLMKAVGKHQDAFPEESKDDTYGFGGQTPIDSPNAADFRDK